MQEKGKCAIPERETKDVARIFCEWRDVMKVKVENVTSLNDGRVTGT